MKLKFAATILLVFFFIKNVNCQEDKKDDNFNSININLVTTGYMLFNKSLILNFSYEHSKNKNYSFIHDFQYWDPYWGSTQIDYILKTRFYLKDYTNGLHLAPYFRFFTNIDNPGSDGKRDNITIYDALGFACGYKFKLNDQFELDIHSNIGYGIYFTDSPHNDNGVLLTDYTSRSRLDYKLAIFWGYKF